MDDDAKDALDEWLIGIAAGPLGGPKTREDAEAYFEHAIADLDQNGFTEEDIDRVTKGDFAGYLLRSVGNDLTGSKR